jgi:pSer/pThr/pTyr-binding forkhead associated (FHA) protein
MNASIKYLNGDKKDKMVPLTTLLFTIGRGYDNNIVLSDQYVSACHATITVLDNGYTLEDNSKNGTLVNGQKIQKQRLRHGDVIEVGDHRLQFIVSSGEEVKAG